MNIIEAIRVGTVARRPGWNFWLVSRAWGICFWDFDANDEVSDIYLTQEDFIANDWEVS